MTHMTANWYRERDDKDGVLPKSHLKPETFKSFQIFNKPVQQSRNIRGMDINQARCSSMFFSKGITPWFELFSEIKILAKMFGFP